MSGKNTNYRRLVRNLRKTSEIKFVDIGETVRVTFDDGSSRVTKTRSRPWKLGNHTWVVMLESVSGCYAMDRVTPVPGRGET